jgi:hypothetical protein
MIKDFTTGKTEFVKYQIDVPDARFKQKNKFYAGGITLKTALFEAKQMERYDKKMIISIFDSKD